MRQRLIGDDSCRHTFGGMDHADIVAVDIVDMDADGFLARAYISQY